MSLAPYYQDTHCTLYYEDSFDIIPLLGDIDAVITDPPYMIGAKSVGTKNSKSGSWVDLMNASFWYREWMELCWRQLLEGGYLLSFTNWRSLPMLMRACSLAEINVQSCAVWDKEWIGPAGADQLRPIYEMIIFCGKGKCRIDDRSVSDIFRCKWMAGEYAEYHPAEKPLMLMCELVSLVTNAGDIVFDPFAGSATTLCASKMLGRLAIGCEANEKYAEIAARRLEHTIADEIPSSMQMSKQSFLQMPLL